MQLSKKHIYWGIGIASGLAALSLLFIKSKNKKVNEIKDKAESWIKPVVAKISSPFGYRKHPVTGVQKLHNGIDLPIPIGTKIKSPMSGTVALVNSGGAGGNQIIIKHDNGYLSGYAHLSKQLVKKGDKVKQGDVIALSGNTGQTTGPHLHFTMKDAAGKYVDPAKVIFQEA